MFTIDLLKGQGVPVKANLKILALTTVAFAVLIFAAIFMFGSYVYNRIVLSTQQRAVNSYNGRFDGLKAALKERETLVQTRDDLNRRLVEVADVLKYESQWSEFLHTLSRYLPGELIVDRLEVRTRQQRMEVPRRSDPVKKITVSVPVRSVVVSLHCQPNCDGDQTVRNFQRKLLDSGKFRKDVKSVEITSREPAIVNDREVINYQLNCIFKSQALQGTL